MSWTPASEPAQRDCPGTPGLARILEARPRDIGGFTVGRVLPAVGQRMVGPFIFFDHMGPATLSPGSGVDVRPHPHINLATVTYLFAGAIAHRDNLGSHQVIRPGDINWMTAGRGIAHSERTPPEERARGSDLHGIQLWVALPVAREEDEPSFRHHPAASLPELELGGARMRVLIGAAFGAASPVEIASPMFYVEVALPAGAALPLPAEYRERAAYVLEGALACGGERVEARRLALFAPGAAPEVRAEGNARVMLLGGEPLDGPRHIWWNFVSSRAERIEHARRDWQEGRFPLIPGDAEERIPLPSS
ncbi:MAG TPA: pirin family protein [Kofleriaceae bacterium]|nr:pirin family protein [Kofleriaceae bacterium]